jgi:hypothetical protein
MSEAFIFPEGEIHLWTGTATASALVAYARATEAVFTRGWRSTPIIDGTYCDQQTGQRANVNIQALYTYDSTIMRLDASATAVHVRLNHSGVNGSAGYVLWSGYIDSLAFAGSEGNPYVYTLAYHANAWSAY